MEYPGCRPGRVKPTTSRLWWTSAKMTLSIADGAKELPSCLAILDKDGMVTEDIEAVQFY
jgi:hypothetical protein